MYTTTLDDPNVDGMSIRMNKLLTENLLNYFSQGMVLSIPGIRDRGYVQIGSVWDFAWFLGLALLKLKKKLIFKGVSWCFI